MRSLGVCNNLCLVHDYSSVTIACVAGGSGSEHETFCGEAANSLAGFAREGIFASGVAASEIPACLISYPF